MFPLVWTMLQTRELLNVSNSSRAVCLCRPSSATTYTAEIFMAVRSTRVSHCVSLPLYLPLSSLQPCVPPTNGLCLIQSRELLIQFAFKCVERRHPPAILLCLCFVLPTSRPLYELVWSVVVVCSCHGFLCCCCCCYCCCFLAARFLGECLSSKYGLHQLCWK